MKKISILLVLIVLFALSGCVNKSVSPTSISANAVVIDIASSDKLAAIEEEKIVKELTAMYNTLRMEKVNKSIDESSVINVVYYKDKKEISIFSVDKNGVLYLYRDNKNIYKITNKSIDYKRIASIFEEYKNTDK